MGKIRGLLGERGMENDGGKWRLRVRAEPGKVARVTAEMETKIREGLKIKSPGAYLEHLWKDFA
jgi:hypothetical protein